MQEVPDWLDDIAWRAFGTDKGPDSQYGAREVRQVCEILI